MAQRTAVIIGAGPAGLTAAYDLLKKTDIVPVVFEATGDIGGISKTVNYKGNRIDIGGHRFFSKSDDVVAWWKKILPIQGRPARDDVMLSRDVAISNEPGAPDPETTDNVMLVRNRLSRIFFLRKFFDYPISLNLKMVRSLGLARIARIGASYLKIRLSPIKNERSLEDFFINRFGRELYLTFFKDYTEKVWGISCSQISAEWGAQRIKGLSISKAILHAAKSMLPQKRSLDQKDVETSLIEQFYYPKHGPGQMWEEVARLIRSRGGRIYMNHKAIRIHAGAGRIKAVSFREQASGSTVTQTGDFFFSSMPVKDLVESFDGFPVPEDVRRTAAGLMYRDFITVGLLLKKLAITNETKIPTCNNLIPDCWVYIQEREVKLGRLQVFNNWSPYMVHDPDNVWIGLEYFCNSGDELWNRRDADFAQFAIDELVSIGVIDSGDVLDSTVIRMPKTYPAYFGTYSDFPIIRRFVDGFDNLFLVGRNGMHKYNNSDHSMLTAMTAVDNIINGITSKENIWAVNTESQYHEKK
jgi:protoporphyrinogen oxidase